MTEGTKTLDGDLLHAAVQVAQVDRVVEDFKRKQSGRKPFATPAAARAAHGKSVV